MKLISITLKNFRCYKNSKRIEFDSLTTLIGKNDIGKSSVLEALEIFFNNQMIKIDPTDCSIGSDDSKVEITCEFSELPENIVLDSQAETTLSGEYLIAQNGNLVIKKTYNCTAKSPKEDVVLCAYHPTATNYSDLLEMTNANLKKRISELHIDSANILLNNNSHMRAAIWRSCNDLCLQEVEIPVNKEDSKRIWENISEYLPVYALFQSDRSSKDSDIEVQDPMKLAIISALAEPEIDIKLKEITEAVKNKACELATRTHQELSKIDSNLASTLRPEFKSDPKWNGIFSLTLNSDDGIPVNKRGSGIRRLILLSFFRAEANRKLSENPIKNIIYGIEEPETSQHPHNQKILLEALQDLSAEDRCQVILTTHSPGFAGLLPIESFRFLTKNVDLQPAIEKGSDQTGEAIAKTLGVIPDNRVSVLICVEGPTDVVNISCLSHALHINNPDIIDLTTDPRIAFVVLGGGTLKHWVNNHYLRGLGKPEVHIYDSDVNDYANAVAVVNARTDGSWAIQTQKYEIENYLHPDAIREGLNINVNITDTNDVPAEVGRHLHLNAKNSKTRLSGNAFSHMTAQRILERDPNGEVEGWLRRIGAML